MQAFNYLKNRGLIYQTSNHLQDALQSVFASQSIYLGVDPTAKGLHIGHLIACRVLKRFHDCGMKSIALIGGATAMIGDPSFKVSERNVLSFEDVQTNISEIRKDIEHVLGSSGDDRLLFVDNYDWYKNMNVLVFLRDVGKNMRVQSMLSKESVKKRILSENSMSFAEFSYQCMQEYGCMCQIGGSDQWGNISSGIEYVKRVTDKSVHGMTVQLLTNSQGQKFGKSEGNAIWINKSRTSNNDFYQFFVRQDDANIPLLLRFLTDLPEESMQDILVEHFNHPDKREAQLILAKELMLSIRSQEDFDKAKRCAEVLYGEQDMLTEDMIHDVMDELPLEKLDALEMKGKTISDYLVVLQLAESKKAAKRLVQAGGVRVNGRVIKQPTHMLTDSDLERRIENLP